MIKKGEIMSLTRRSFINSIAGGAVAGLVHR